MSRLILVSFADKRYRNALKRLEQYTEDFPFTERHFHTQENSFTKEYWRDLRPWFYRRGYGYWDWKARLVKYYYDSADEGDMIVWSDVGVYWNSSEKALHRFSEYIALLNDSNGVLAFQEPYIEQEWTKGDLLKELGVYDDIKVCTSLQLWSGCFIIRKQPSTVELVEKWAEVNDIKKELITDKCSEIPNKEGFKEHRHDQSSFSLLVKRMPHVEISWKETQELNKNWSLLDDYPVQARRHKEQNRPIGEVIKNKLLRPWRDFLGFYFKRIRHYEYLCDHYPW